MIKAQSILSVPARREVTAGAIATADISFASAALVKSGQAASKLLSELCRKKPRHLIGGAV